MPPQPKPHGERGEVFPPPPLSVTQYHDTYEGDADIQLPTNNSPIEPPTGLRSL